GLVTLLAATAVARHVFEDLRMLRGEVVGRANHVHRTHRREADVRQRRRRDAHANRSRRSLRRGRWGLCARGLRRRLRGNHNRGHQRHPGNSEQNRHVFPEIHAIHFTSSQWPVASSQKGSGILIDSDGWILDTFTHPPMRLFGRQALLLIAAFTTALVIVFSSSISSALDYAREIERQSGLTLLPALVI